MLSSPARTIPSTAVFSISTDEGWALQGRQGLKSRRDAESVFAIVMMIDSHQHFWKYDPARDTWITEEMSILKRDFLPEDLGREYQANGIAASLAVQAAQSETKTQFLLGLATCTARIAGVVAWFCLCSSKAAERLAYFARFVKLRRFPHI